MAASFIRLASDAPEKPVVRFATMIFGVQQARMMDAPDVSEMFKRAQRNISNLGKDSLKFGEGGGAGRGGGANADDDEALRSLAGETESEMHSPRPLSDVQTPMVSARGARPEDL